MENNKNGPLESREQFSTRIAFVLASVGGAVGLGNVWKFPYVVGKYGGAAFIVVYLLALFLVATPILITEFAIGRMTSSSYPTALKKLFPGTKWYVLGIIGVISLTLTLSFYSGVSGWTIAYIFKSATGQYAGMDGGQIAGVFGQFISDPKQVLLWMGIMLLITTVIVAKGVREGIEKICNILLPLLFALIIVLAIRAIMLPGASKGLNFYLKPDFSHLTAEGVLAAIGQAFFSLGVGAGNLVVYGSYLDKKKTIGSSGTLVAVGDLLAAFLFGFIIFPAAFAYNIEAGMGPPLVFITLPAIFAQMKAGLLFATVFFVLLFFACLTSTVCIMEAIVAYAVDELGWERKKATWSTFVLVFILGTFMMLSFGPLAEFKIIKWSIFDFANDVLVTTILLPLGALLMAILVGWKLKPKQVLDEINTGEGMKLQSYYTVTIKYIVPIAIVAMFLQLIGVFG